MFGIQCVQHARNRFDVSGIRFVVSQKRFDVPEIRFVVSYNRFDVPKNVIYYHSK